MVVNIVQQRDAKLILGGSFTQVGGVVRRGIARVNTNGTVDTSFDPGIWFNTAEQHVLRLALQPDERIMVLTELLGNNAILVRLHGDQKPFFLSDVIPYYRSREGNMNLVFTANENRGFVVEATSTLSPPDWREISVRRFGTSNDTIGVTDAAGFPKRFYRVRQTTTPP